MAEPTPQTINHFALYSFGEAYWKLPSEERAKVRGSWLRRMREVGTALHLYQVFPTEAEADLLVWTARPAETPDVARGFFAAYAAACAELRPHARIREAFWGFTRPSPYTKTRSTQEADPFGKERKPYLVLYPFVKTHAWYQKGREERGAMMMDHVKVGKGYPEILQLLLYSTGLQDQEFVVVYEIGDLLRFLDLVTDLRSTQARPFTERDYPLHTALHQADEGALDAWL
ncbi:MAG TPA: chlorite dismutase family protein [Planctomycetota bacterium]|nr:chlorite dismutase family protein [Planctomycetota bacterium]